MGRIRANRQMALTESFINGSESKIFLNELPDMILKINEQPDSSVLADWFVQSVPNWISGAKRASVFAIDKDLGRIELLAHRPALKPILSDTLAYRAWEEGLAFSWKQVGKDECVRRLNANAGLYVPMMVLDEEVGMLCVEDTAEGCEFSPEHLAVLVMIGQLMALPLLYRIQKESV